MFLFFLEICKFESVRDYEFQIITDGEKLWSTTISLYKK